MFSPSSAHSSGSLGSPARRHKKAPYKGPVKVKAKKGPPINFKHCCCELAVSVGPPSLPPFPRSTVPSDKKGKQEVWGERKGQPERGKKFSNKEQLLHTKVVMPPRELRANCLGQAYMMSIELLSDPLQLLFCICQSP